MGTNSPPPPSYHQPPTLPLQHEKVKSPSVIRYVLEEANLTLRDVLQWNQWPRSSSPVRPVQSTTDSHHTYL